MRDGPKPCQVRAIEDKVSLRLNLTLSLSHFARNVKQRRKER